ncbi:uncharacterized protein BXZ73DRAFT_92854 [Epithele typhae]|uniref:uncharacterized protein n=1 Tax=Epithele typhae TaxID=378194 RepID=UPI002007DA3D|nr:uncharacterized protein BXZ73DRAFT_92854 [Epithele typhae]KAH9914061.1 hypothetical protein BXZ73DRAFT_92854 [Epithele typhae]
MLRFTVALLSLAVFVPQVVGQTWCGKNYMSTDPPMDPGGQFPIPASSSTSLLALRCSPAIKPYLSEDASAPQTFVIDAPITFSQIAGAAPVDLSSHNARAILDVTVKVGGKTLAKGPVAVNASKAELPFSLEGLDPQTTPFDVECSATLGKQTFTTTSALSFLPPPPDGRSVTKMDMRTGALLAKPATGMGGEYETVFPVGFYSNFDGYLTNLSVIDEIAAQGFTVIHPIPTFDNLTALAEVVQRMEEVGIYLMYDMRWTYMNNTAVTEEVNRIKNSPALLLWYTGDEPDGTSDPLNATTIAYDLIYSLDGYHPVSLVLNCENYYWTEYTSGTDIVMQDTYMIGINATYSTVWNTPCTPDYGDCGCDNCQGEFEDISTRMDEFAQRGFIDSWELSKAAWTVPQGFGASEYWDRVPTGQEFIVQSVLAINHGALGVVSWNAPSSDDITASAALLSRSLAADMKAFILHPHASFEHTVVSRVDVGSWTVGDRTLVLATNLNYAETKFDLSSLKMPVDADAVGHAKQVLDSGAKLEGRKIVLESVGTGAFILG